MSRRSAPTPASSGELASLIEHERALEDRLAAARAEAEALVESARQRAAASEAAVDAQLESGRAAIEHEVAAATRSRIDELTSRAAARAARYRGLAGAELDRLANELAELLVRELTGGDA